MKGNPLLRLVIIVMLLIVVFWPVLKITRHIPIPTPLPTPAIETNAATQSSTNPIIATLSVTLLVHAAPAPLHCSIAQQGLTLLSESNAIAPGEYRAAVDIVKGYDLVITADWKDGEPHALRTEVLVHGYQAPLEKTFWAQQSLEDTLPIPDSFLP